MREECFLCLIRHCLPTLSKERGRELGETPHLVEVHLLRHLRGVVDEEGAEECGDGEQAHGPGLRGSDGIDTLIVQQDSGEILAL